MMFGWRKDLKQTVRQAKQEQKKLKRLTDEELMRLHDTLMAGPLSGRLAGATLHETFDEISSQQVKLLAAIYEVERRLRAAGWFWRRWRHPEDWEKWQEWRRLQASPAKLLSVFGYQNTVESLCEALYDSPEWVRGQAAAALGDLGDKNAVPALIDALQDESSQVRGHCVASLMGLKDERAINPLIKLLRDEDSEVRGLAAAALGELADRTAIKPLIAALNDILAVNHEDENVSHFIVALETLCNKTDIPLIINALRDFGENFSECATIILKQLCDENDIPLIINTLRDLGENFSGCAIILNDLCNENHIQYLKSVVSDESEYVRIVAAAILAKLGDSSGLAYLLEDTSENGRRVALAAGAVFAELMESEGD